MTLIDEPNHDSDLNPKFLRWLAANGVDTSKCESKLLDFGRGLAATKDIAENEIIVAIPEKLLLTPDIVLQDHAHPLFVYKESFTRIEILILLLLHEKSRSRRLPNHERSFWHYYIESLPREYGIPSYWTEDDFLLLKRREGCSNKYAESRKEYQYVCDLFMKVTACGDELTQLIFGTSSDDGQWWPDLRWAHGTVWTRSCTYENGARQGKCLGGAESCLVPFADLLNHHPDFFGDGQTCGLGMAIPYIDTKDTDEPLPDTNNESLPSLSTRCLVAPDRKDVEQRPTMHYIFRAAHKIAKDSECFICYGQKTNWELLLNYGFALSNDSNPCDLVSLQADKVLKLCDLWITLDEHPERETMYAFGQLQNDNWYVRSNKTPCAAYDSSISYSMEVVFRTLLSSTLSFHDVFTHGKMGNEAAEEAVVATIIDALNAIGSQMANADSQAESRTHPDIASVIRSEYRQIERVIAHLRAQRNR